MNTHDNIMIPILITDKDGIIIYKNRAAKRCVPSPRGKGNINNYLNTKMSKYRIQNQELKVEFIKNSASVFNRALVFAYGEDREIWCFIPELMLSEPEEMHRFIGKIDTESINSFLTDISEQSDTKDKSLFVRHQRVYTELLSAMKELNTENNTLRFPASDILSSLKKKTAELASRYGLRMSFEIAMVDLLKPYRLDFEAFASVYIQLLSLALRLTDTTGCAVTAFPSKQSLVLTVTSAPPASAADLPPVITTDKLCDLYPDQSANILLLEATARFHSFGFEAGILDGRLALRLDAPLTVGATAILHQEPAKIIVQTRFNRLEKRLYEYLEAMFLQV